MEKILGVLRDFLWFVRLKRLKIFNSLTNKAKKNAAICQHNHQSVICVDYYFLYWHIARSC